MVEIQLVIYFLVALAIGTLIGLEREYSRYKRGGRSFAGVRTFMFISLFGALAAYFGDLFHIGIFIAGFISLAGFVMVHYYLSTRKHPAWTGTTTYIASLITFLLGALSYYGKIRLAVLLAVIMTVLLYFKEFIHQFIKKMKAKELDATLKFAIVAFVILPFLPNVDYGPHGIFNPFIIWLMVVFVSGISFIGYVLMRWFGERGIELTGIFGGLASSTAVTLSFSQRSKHTFEVNHLLIGVVLANAVMFIRVLIELLVLQRELFTSLLIPLLFLTAVSVGLAFLVGKKSWGRNEKVELSSPFTFLPALKVGALFALMIALVKFVNVYFQSKGIYAASFISGFMDVDPIVISLTQVNSGSVPLEVARNAILIAALTNMAGKGIIAFVLGGKEFGRKVLGVFAAIIVLGTVMLVLL